MSGALVTQDMQWLEIVGATGGLPVPFSHDIVLAETTVAGTNHVNAITCKTKDLKAGCELKAVREPENMFDRKAIRLETQAGVKLGYVPRGINDMPRRLMDAGKLLVFRVTGRSVVDHYVKITGELILRGC